jgi:hypothetical protein
MPYGGRMCVQFGDGTIAQVVEWRGAKTAHSVPWRSKTAVRAMSCQTYQLCYVDDEGTARCAGRDTPEQAVPLFDGVEAKVVASAIGTWCIVTTAGAPMCLPTTNYQTGKPSSAIQVAFEQMGPLQTIIDGTRCAITESGDLMCIEPVRRPSGATEEAVLKLSDVRQASLVMSGPTPIGCAVRTNGRVWCWGSNRYGEVGDGTRTYRETPVEVLGVTDATYVSASGTHACALTAKHELYCWGASAGPDGKAAMDALPTCKVRKVKSTPVQCPPVGASGDDVCRRMQWNAAQNPGDDVIVEEDGTCVRPDEKFVARAVRITTVTQPIAVATQGTWTFAISANGEVAQWSRAVFSARFRIPTVISDRPM